MKRIKKEMNSQELQELEEQIREKMSIFPNKTRRVAEYILGNSSEIAFNSISETASKLSVSRAQLVRVARMLGFGGYADLKNTLKRELLTQVIPSAVSINAEDDGQIPTELNRLEQANIEETCRNFMRNQKEIDRFCEQVKKSDCIYCMGWGISAMPAEWFFARFCELGLKSVLLRRGSLSLVEQSRGIGKKDMLVVCELPSYVREVAEAVENIYNNKAFITAITDTPAAPICSFSAQQFFVSDHSPLFGSSLIGPMFAVHVLTSILACSMGNDGKKALKAQKETLTDERIYYPSYGLRY